MKAHGLMFVSVVVVVCSLTTRTLCHPQTDSRILNLYEKKFSGYGTFSSTGPHGPTLCQFSPPDLPPVAKSSLIRTTAGLGDSLMYGGLACGTCFKAHASGEGSGRTPLTGNFYVFVDNVCAGCGGEGSLNLGEFGDGRWDLTIQAVQCPVGNTNLEYAFQSSSQWHIKLQIRNHRLPITEVRLFQKSVWNWTPLKPTSDGFWEMDPAEKWHKPLELPLRIEMTAANGAILEDDIAIIGNNVVIPGNVQVPYDPNMPSMETGNDASTLQLRPVISLSGSTGEGKAPEVAGEDKIKSADPILKVRR